MQYLKMYVAAGKKKKRSTIYTFPQVTKKIFGVAMEDDSNILISRT